MSHWSSVCANVITLIAACGSSLSATEISARDWPWWRGPERNGAAHPDQNPPLRWNDADNIAWQTPVPGRGHGSPIVLGDRVLVTAADHETQQQLVICLNRDDGTEVWREVIHQGGFPDHGNEKSSLASTTPACDGTRVFVNFYNDGSVLTTALKLDSGQRLWQQKITDYVIHEGYASSPALYDNLVIVSADNKGGGAVSALNSETGKIVWTRKRPVKPNYPSPIILHVANRDQLLLTGCDLVTSLNPATGKVLWEITGATTECVTSVVTDGKRVFTSGGYPDNHIAAVDAAGAGNEVWRIPVRTYVPSMLIHNGVLHAVMDAGIATCRIAETGEELWKARLGGTFSSSPVLVGDRIYVTNESGLTFVYSTSTNGFELLAKNQLGDDVFATPVICDSRIYARIATHIDGKRQEFVYCIAESGR